MISKIKQKKSIILVDDIFSELDEKRRSNMIDLLKNKSQLIFTMVTSDYITGEIQGDFRIFSVDNGRIYTK
jgi:recombinational DNA repair ATPase RecF